MTIENEYVGRVAPHNFAGAVEVAGFVDHGNAVALQDHAKTSADDRVIVDQDDVRRGDLGRIRSQPLPPRVLHCRHERYIGTKRGRQRFAANLLLSLSSYPKADRAVCAVVAGAGGREPSAGYRHRQQPAPQRNELSCDRVCAREAMDSRGDLGPPLRSLSSRTAGQTLTHTTGRFEVRTKHHVNRKMSAGLVAGLSLMAAAPAQAADTVYTPVGAGFDSSAER